MEAHVNKYAETTSSFVQKSNSYENVSQSSKHFDYFFNTIKQQITNKTKGAANMSSKVFSDSEYITFN